MGSFLVGHTNPLGSYPAPVLPVLLSEPDNYHARRGDQLIAIVRSAVTMWPDELRARLLHDRPELRYFAFSSVDVVAYSPREELRVLLDAVRDRGLAKTSPFLFVSYSVAHDSVALAQLALPFALRDLHDKSPAYAGTWMAEILESSKPLAPALSQWLSQQTIPDLLAGRSSVTPPAALTGAAPSYQPPTVSASSWNEREAALFSRWRDGDDSALEEILKQNLPWVHQYVEERLGPDLRAKTTTEDVVQEAMVDFLRNGPRFVPENHVQLRALLARIVANTLTDTSNWFRAARRRISMEVPLALSLELRDESVEPWDNAASQEQHQRLRIAMEMLSERDRKIVYWRIWDDLSFLELAGRLRVDAEAARAAARRAIERLRDARSRLGEGDLDGALALAGPSEDSSPYGHHGSGIERVVMPFSGVGVGLTPEGRARFIADLVEVVEAVQKRLEQRGVRLEASLKSLADLGSAGLALEGLQSLIARIDSAEVKRTTEWADAHRVPLDSVVADAKARAISALTSVMVKCLTGRLTVAKRERLELTLKSLEAFSRTKVS